VTRVGIYLARCHSCLHKQYCIFAFSETLISQTGLLGIQSCPPTPHLH